MYLAWYKNYTFDHVDNILTEFTLFCSLIKDEFACFGQIFLIQNSSLFPSITEKTIIKSILQEKN